MDSIDLSASYGPTQFVDNQCTFANESFDVDQHSNLSDQNVHDSMNRASPDSFNLQKELEDDHVVKTQDHVIDHPQIDADGWEQQNLTTFDFQNSMVCLFR